jgi:hypothetical protein
MTALTIPTTSGVVDETVIEQVTDSYGLAKDINNYSFEAVAGNKYQFIIETSSTYKDFNDDIQYNLIEYELKKDGTALGTDDGLSIDDTLPGKSVITIVAQESGTYNLDIFGFAGYESSEYGGMSRIDTPYKLYAQDFGSVDNYANNKDLATEITLATGDDGMLHGSISDASIYSTTDDVDWFKFAAVTTKDYAITVTNATGETKKILVDTKDRDIHFGKDDFTHTQKYITPSNDADISFNITGTIGDYELAIDEIVVDAHGATEDTATTLTLDAAAVEGNILNFTDNDMFKLTTEVGSIYQATIRSTELDSWRENNDYIVGVHGHAVSDATILWKTSNAVKYDYDDYVVVDFKATDTTTYIELESWFATGDYTIEVTQKEDDYAWDFTNYASLSNVPTLQLSTADVDNSINGNILDITDYAVSDYHYDSSYNSVIDDYIDMNTQFDETPTSTGNDIDLFKFSAESGKVYHFKAVALNGFSPMFNIIDANGDRVETNISGNWTPIELSNGWVTDFIFTAEDTSSNYYLEVIGQGAVGNYKVSYSEFQSSDDSVGGNDFTSAQELDISADKAVVSSSVDSSGDNDIFKFAVIQDNRYEIKLDEIGYSGSNGPYDKAEVFVVKDGKESQIYDDQDMFDIFFANDQSYNPSLYMIMDYDLEKMKTLLSILDANRVAEFRSEIAAGNLSKDSNVTIDNTEYAITYDEYIDSSMKLIKQIDNWTDYVYVGYISDYSATIDYLATDWNNELDFDFDIKTNASTYQSYLDNYTTKIVNILDNTTTDLSANDSSIKDTVISLMQSGLGIDSSSKISYTALEDGYIYVRADDANQEYYYTLNVQKKGGDYIGDDVATAVLYDQADKSNGELKSYSELGNNATADGTIIGTLEKVGDKDFYKVELEAYKEYEFVSNKWYTDIKFYDADGKRIVEDSVWQSEGDGSVKDVHIGITGTKKTFAVAETGIYYVAMSTDDEWANWTGDYELSMSETTKDDDFGSSTHTAGDFAAYVNTFTDSDNNEYTGVKGAIDYARDSDWIRIDTVAGKDYKIELETLTDDNGDKIKQPKVKILNEDGQEVFLKSSYIYNNADSDLDERGTITIDWDSDKDAAMTLTSTGDVYYVQIESYRDTGEYILTYEEDNTLDDYGSSFKDMADFIYINNTDSDASDNTISAKINKLGDEDWFSYAFEKGGVYELTLDSATISGDKLRVYFGETVANKTKDAATSSTTDHNYIFTSKYDGFGIISVADTYGVGDYTLKVTKLESDEFDGDRDNAVDISLTEGAFTSEESLLNSKDHDYKKISLVAGKTYTVEIIAKDDTNKTALGQMKVLLKDDKIDNIINGVVREWNPTDAMERLSFTADASGEYYLDIYSVTQGIGEYTLNVNEIDMTNDIGSTLAEAEEFATLDSDSNGSITSTINTTFDKDFIKVSATADTQYLISIDTDATSTTGKIYILDESGEVIYKNQIWESAENSTLGTGDKSILFNAPESKDYYIVVQDNVIGDYTLSYEEYTDSSDLSADSSDAGTLSSGKTSSSITQADDKDWIAIDMVEGQVYELSVSNSSDAMSLDASFVINGLYDGSSNFIDGTSSSNGVIYYKAESSGTYYLEVASGSDSIGIYDVSASSYSASDSITATTDTTASIAVDEKYRGVVDYYYDKDWIEITVESGKTYDVSMVGGTLDNSVIGGIYDSTGTMVSDTYNDNASNFTLDSKAQFTATGTTYYVEAKGFKSDVGTYELEVSETTATTSLADESDSSNDANNTTSTAISDNKLKQYIYGEINYDGDSDLYEFDFEEGVTYTVSMYGSSTKSGTLNDTWIKSIKDSSGVAIEGLSDARGGMGTNSELTFTAQESGNFFIETSSLNGALGSFRLKVKETAGVNSDVKATEGSGSHTIMIYLAGDNNLEKYMVDDLIEMQLGELPDGWNVTFLIDRAEGFYTGFGDWTDTRQGIVTFADESNEDEAYTEVLSAMESLGEQNTGDGQTMTNFMNWTMMNAQADSYSLVISNHGGGIPGTAWDEGNGNDNLTIPELTEAIKNSMIYKDAEQNGDKALSMVAFDTCLQGIIDQQYALTDVTDTVVASEEVSWSFYWDHEQWFNNITEMHTDNGGNISGDEMGIAFMDTIKTLDTKGKDVTYSVVNTEALAAVTSALAALNSELTTITSEQQKTVSLHASNVVSFGESSNIDIGAFAQMIKDLDLSDTINTKATTLISSINSAVIDNFTNMSGEGGDATGISMYYNGGYESSSYLNNFELASIMNMQDFYDIV